MCGEANSETHFQKGLKLLDSQFSLSISSRLELCLMFKFHSHFIFIELHGVNLKQIELKSKLGKYVAICVVFRKHGISVRPWRCRNVGCVYRKVSDLNILDKHQDGCQSRWQN